MLPLRNSAAAMDEEAELVGYYEQNANLIEMHLTKAVDETVSRGAANPIAEIGVRLLESQHIDTATVRSSMGTAQASREDEDRSSVYMRRIIHQMHQNQRSRASSPAMSQESQEAPKWDLLAWLTSLDLVELVATALRQSLQREIGACAQAVRDVSI